jgi:hypothetical protein
MGQGKFGGEFTAMITAVRAWAYAVKPKAVATGKNLGALLILVIDQISVVERPEGEDPHACTAC